MAGQARTRQELVHLMEGVMNQAYSNLIGDQELSVDTNLVKTYLVESHLTEAAEPGEILELLRRFESVKVSRNGRIAISETDDPTLIIISSIVENEDVSIYADVSNPRFWTLHSANRSTTLDKIMDRLVKEDAHIDRGWLWPELLADLVQLGSFRGMGLDFDRREIPDVNFDESEEVEYFKMQLWGGVAPRVYEILRKNFPSSTTLAKIKLKHYLAGGNEDEFSVDDIKYDGKLTTRGTSFQSHLTLVNNVFRYYASSIRKIEAEHALKWESGDGGTYLSGDSLSLMFSEGIKDVEKFCQHVFSAAQPFGLWGVPVRVSSNYYRVSAVDLHSASRIDLEISPDFIRLYLPTGSCGNTVARLYTNLKHHYNSTITLQAGNGNRIF